MTPAKHVAEFGGDKFCTEGGLLWCKVGDSAVDHVRRQTIVDHTKSQKTLWESQKKQAADSQGGQAPKRQATTASSLERATAASTFKETLLLDLIEAFVSANIPPEKLDNPRMRNFIETHNKEAVGFHRWIN